MHVITMCLQVHAPEYMQCMVYYRAAQSRWWSQYQQCGAANALEFGTSPDGRERETKISSTDLAIAV